MKKLQNVDALHVKNHTINYYLNIHRKHLAFAHGKGVGKINKKDIKMEQQLTCKINYLKCEKLRERKIHCQNEIFPMRKKIKKERMKSSAMTMTTRRRRRCARQCEGSIKKNSCISSALFHLTRAIFESRKKKSLMSFGTRASHGDRLPPRQM